MAIYTHDEGAKILDEFENVLSKYNIHVPSPEDNDREKDNMIGLYGSTYSELLDNIEKILISVLAKHTADKEIISDEFSRKY